MANNSKLDMSLDSLIKNQRNKPTGQQKGKLVQQKQQGKGTFQSQQKGGFKAKGAAPQQQKGMQMKAKGGVAKPGSAGRAGGAKFVQQQQRPGQQSVKGSANVRVVPRPGLGPRPGAAARPGFGPRPGPRPGPGFRPPPMMGGPRGMFGPGPLMGLSPMQLQQQMLQQQMMAQQMMAPAVTASPATAAPASAKETPLFDGSVVSISTSAKLLISNLDFKVTDEDIKELFGTVGPIKDSAVNYDKSGRSMGTATVVFDKRGDALAAFNRYNNVSLDNKKMMIEVVETAVPRGTFTTLSSGINVSRQTAAGGAGGSSVRGRGVPHVDHMQE